MISGSLPGEPALVGAAACHGRRPATARKRERLVERLKAESGYSLVEVMVSILLLSIAIIPMVAMFDMGLNAATRAGNYDKARAFATERVERAKALPYRDVKGKFPVANSTPGAGGTYTSASPLDVPAGAGLPDGATYTVKKQYVRVQPDAASGTPAPLENAPNDSRMMRVTVSVDWVGDSAPDFTSSGFVSRGIS